MTNVDQLFNRINPQMGDFNFDENVAEVFDDMISRSVPLYAEVQQLIPSLAELLDHGGVGVRGDMLTVGNTGLGPDWRSASAGTKYGVF